MSEFENIKKAVFIDKDGTLIPNIPYNVDPERITIDCETVEGLRLLKEEGFLLIVVSNQSGIAKGYFEERDLVQVWNKISALLQKHDVSIDAFYYCPHEVSGSIEEYAIECGCRKPMPGMILRACQEFNIDCAQSWMVGDILNDVEAGKRAGCSTVLVDNGNETEWRINELRNQFVMWHMVKDEQLRDNPPNPEYQEHMATYEKLLPVYSTDQPEVHDIVQKMRKVLNEYEQRMMIGEIYLPIHKLITYYGIDSSGAHLPFNFLLLAVPWDAQHIASSIAEYEGALPKNAWPNWVLGNHDQPRITSRVGLQQAKVAAMLLLTLRGTPTIYYGDEIAMADVPIPFDEVQDPQGLNMPDKNLSRDPQRTPMQWNDTENAGFSNAKPWLRLSASYKRKNVEVQNKDPYSMLWFYKQLIELRQKENAFTIGDYKPVHADKQSLAYIRQAQNSKSYLVVLNLSHRPCYLNLQHIQISGKVVLSTSPELHGTLITERIQLSGDEGMIVELEKSEN